VVQFVLEHGKPEDRAVIISKLRGQMLHMARHKFASNVCEKALMMADLDNRRLLIDEIMTPKPDGVSPIVTMMKDQFASSLCPILYYTTVNLMFYRLRSPTVLNGGRRYPKGRACQQDPASPC
jgi:Pumilio-family RNA binding repeat